MAPSVGRTDRQVLAIGSPGADRITTALHQFLINYVQLGHNLADAVAHPRLHLEIDGSNRNIAVEPGLDLPDTGISVTKYPDISMYFGGVVAAAHDSRDGFSVAADPRRAGGTFVGEEG
jgi:gamma-glutamyltranspeptidase/glutathione hydrolase